MWKIIHNGDSLLFQNFLKGVQNEINTVIRILFQNRRKHQQLIFVSNIGMFLTVKAIFKKDYSSNMSTEMPWFDADYTNNYSVFFWYVFNLHLF